MKLSITATDYKRNILEVINSIDVVDFKLTDGEPKGLKEVLIEDSLVNQVVIDTVTIISQSDYDIRKNTKDGYINIVDLGFEFANWWDINEGFQVK